jgi:hypothetical protein
MEELRVLFIGLILLLSWTGQKIAQVLTNNEPAFAGFYFYLSSANQSHQSLSFTLIYAVLPPSRRRFLRCGP